MVAGLLVVSFVTPPYALANPQAGQVRQGQVRIDASGSQLRIHQQSQRAVIDWQSFSIDRGETTRFVQPNSAAAVLNRVRGDSASQIEGMLRANGKVYLINPNGILVGPNGTIDVGGFVASTLDVGDRAFMKGGDLRFSGNSDAAVVNLGAISALDGDVVLMGASVLNAGSIRAPRGTAALAAGNDILLTESGEERVFVRGASGSRKAEGVTNTGSIEANVAELKAHGGNLYGMAVKNEGRVAATGVTRRGGQIFLTAKGGKVRSTGSLKATRSDGSGGRVKVDSGGSGGRTEIGGTVDASGRAGAGGEIVILGNEIEIFEGALILNDGATMGGTTRIGGGVRGEDPRFANARAVSVGSGAILSANAEASGNGGLVVVFAEGSLVFDGSISARGGSAFGDGGFAELSGKETVRIANLAGRIDLSAPAGSAGTFLYDPTNISILPGSSSPIAGSPVTQNTLYAGDIASFLATANLIVTTASAGTDIGNITIDGAANITWNSASSLTFFADNDFAMNPGATIYATGAGAFSVTAARVIIINNGASIRTTHGNLTLSANQQPIPTAGTFPGIFVPGGTVRSMGTGSVTVAGRGGDGGGSQSVGVWVFSGGSILGGDTAPIVVRGRGGAASGDFNAGVAVSGRGSRIGSSGGSVLVEGFAGGTNRSQYNRGVEVAFGGLITNSGTGAGATTTVRGYGGNTGGTAGFAQIGINLSGSGSAIGSAGGPVLVEGFGGGIGSSSLNYGLLVQGGASIFSTGTNPSSATVAVLGEGGNAAGGSSNHGVILSSAYAITSASGAISVSASGTPNSAAVVLNGSASILSGGGASVLLLADSLDLGGGVSINSGTGTTLLAPRSAGTLINLGGADVLSGSPLTLGLDDAELDRITSGTLQIGNSSSGAITVSAPITHGNHLTLTTGAGATFNSSVTMAANRNLEVEAASTISLAGANARLSASGTGAVTLTTARDIALWFGAGIATVDGNLTLSANRQAVPTTGDFSGITLSGGTIETTGSGLLSLAGRAGDGSNPTYGIFVDGTSSLSRISGGSAGTTLIDGISGTGSGLFNYGVRLIGNEAILTSHGSDLEVTGRSLGSGSSSFNIGVGIANGATVTSGSGGAVSIYGTGGTGPGGTNIGIDVTGLGLNVPTLTTGGGNLALDGTRGSGSIDTHGIRLSNGLLTTRTNGGDILLTSTSNLLVENGSQILSTEGEIRLSANQGALPTSGNFTGIVITGASTLAANGDGSLVLTGRGGDGSLSPDFTNPSSAGVRIAGGSVLVSSGTGEDAGAITIEGQGGGGASDSIGVVIDGTDTLVQTADSDLSILGHGGGNATGFRNRGISFNGATLQAGGSGELSLEGWGGQGVGMIDGIQLDGNATLQVEDGLLRLVGNAGGSLGIGIMATSGSGDIRSVGTGAIEISGAGSNAAGVNLGNSGAALGGSSSTSLLVESQGDLVLGRPSSVAGPVTLRALSDEVFVNAPATSTGGDLRVEGFDLTVNAALSAPVGNLTLQFGESDPLVSAPLDGIARVNALLTHGGAIGYVGGSGLGDTLTFAGYGASAIEFDFALLTGIENVVGTAFTTDRLLGPAVDSLYTLTGNNAFTVGGVSFSAFENVLGGDGDDTFAFAGSATLSGTLDGGGGTNTLDYAAYSTGVIVNLEGGGATGIVGGFSNITSFSGSGNIDTVTGPGSASLYEINAPDSVQVGSASVTGFENLVGGPLNDRFVFLPGASLSGTLDGGGGADILDYSGFRAPVAINFATAPVPLATGISGGFSRIGQFIGSAATTNAVFGPNTPTTYQITGTNALSTPLFTATSFQNLNGGVGDDRFLMGPGASLTGRLSGGAGSDTLSFASFGRAVTVEIGPNTATGLGGGFAEMETIIGSSNNDRFRFLNQASIDLVDGGGGTDLLEIDDTNLSGDQTYTITANSISRNPVYNFRNFDAVRLFLGNGNNTVNSGFYAFNQFLHAGNGFNTLNLPGVTTLNGANPIQNVHHFGFDAPRPAGTDTGGLLKLQIEQRNTGTGLQTQQGFQTENRFSIVDPATLNSQIGALGNAFSAAIVAQAIVISVEGNSYLVLRPFSLDGSGLKPSNLGLAALQENLGIEANLELAAAIGFDGSIFLFNPDGPYALDLSGLPADPAIFTLLNESLSIAAAAELYAALGLNLVVIIVAADGIVPIALDGSVAGAGVVIVLTEQFSDPASAELNAALPAGN